MKEVMIFLKKSKSLNFSRNFGKIFLIINLTVDYLIIMNYDAMGFSHPPFSFFFPFTAPMMKEISHSSLSTRHDYVQKCLYSTI